MNALQRIQAILAVADQSLTQLATECLASRDFDGATASVEAARKLSSLFSAGVGARIEEVLPKTPVVSTADAISLTEDVQSTVAPTSATRSSRTRKGDYPKFVRDGETLVKIGWSKSDRTEYEHKSPKKVFAHLLPAITKSGLSGKKFSMDKVLPLKDDEGTEIPGYQAYLCLAWLRTIGLVQQHGRQGYTIQKMTDIKVATEAAWEKLPARV